MRRETQLSQFLNREFRQRFEGENTNKEQARRFGIPEATLSKLRNGRNELTEGNARKIAKAIRDDEAGQEDVVKTLIDLAIDLLLRR